MTRPAFSTARRIVVKVGSALLQSGPDTIISIADDISALMKDGKQVVLVSSGAIALGRPRLGLDKSELSLEQKQAAAAAGQPVLVQAWENAFAAHDRVTAQALITLEITESRRHWLNARSTLNTLLDYGVIPIVNENDTVATDEIRYGDNDRLAARVAQLVGADLLVLLSDIEGMYDSDPRNNPDARLMAEIETITPAIHAMASDANAQSGVGTGGMKTKIIAAEMATASGCATLIGPGAVAHPVSRLKNKTCGSFFHPAQSSSKAREQWIAGALDPKGDIRIDAGAEKALQGGKSLLPVGVMSISGNFERGDTVQITNQAGQLIARGVASYDASEARRILGRKTSEIDSILGYRRTASLVHTDDIVLVQNY